MANFYVINIEMQERHCLCVVPLPSLRCLSPWFCCLQLNWAPLCGSAMAEKMAKEPSWQIVDCLWSTSTDPW